MTIFDCLNEIITYKKGDLIQNSEFDKIWNNFMIIRFLTFSKNKEIKKIGLECARNGFYDLSKEELYKYLFEAIKKTPFVNIKYSKKPIIKKEEVEVEDDVTIEITKKTKSTKTSKKKQVVEEPQSQCNVTIFNLFD